MPNSWKVKLLVRLQAARWGALWAEVCVPLVFLFWLQSYNENWQWRRPHVSFSSFISTYLDFSLVVFPRRACSGVWGLWGHLKVRCLAQGHLCSNTEHQICELAAASCSWFCFGPITKGVLLAVGCCLSHCMLCRQALKKTHEPHFRWEFTIFSSAPDEGLEASKAKTQGGVPNLGSPIFEGLLKLSYFLSPTVTKTHHAQFGQFRDPVSL